MISVEKITKADAECILGLAQEAHSESFYRNYPFDAECMQEVIDLACEDDNYFGVKFIKDGIIVGTFLAMVSKMPFSTQLFGVDCGFFLKPENRGGLGFKLMFGKYLEWCKRKDVLPFCCIHYSDDNEKTYSAMNKLKMSERGRIFIGE